MNELIRKNPPPTVWFAAILVIFLRGLPFVRLIIDNIHSETPTVPASYLPMDWLQYVALIRQPSNSIFLTNPFTTDPQGQRIILLFHKLLNFIHGISGIDPFWLLELSRIPLLLIFFLVLWRFVRKILSSSQECVWAVWLVAISGGIDYLLRFARELFPSQINETVKIQLYSLKGWSSFASFWNPLWISGFILLIIVLGVALRPEGPRGWRDYVIITVGFIILWFTHLYSGVAALSAILGSWIFTWAASGLMNKRAFTGVLIGLAPAIASVTVISLWQLNDPVFRATSGGIFGEDTTEIFWYPLTLGVLFFAVIRSGRIWIDEARTWRFALAGWVLSIALLHSSPILYGSHFVCYLHLPVCILAAPVISRIFQKDSTIQALNRIILIVLLFGSSISVTFEALAAVRYYKLPPGSSELFSSLNKLPAGNVLSSASFGNLIPAYTPHKVYVGHWFMTPNYDERTHVYDHLIEDADPIKLRELVFSNNINYIVVSSALASKLFLTFEDLNPIVESFGPCALIRLREK